PLIQKLLSVPTYKRMYIAHCKTMLLENFDNNNYYVTGQELQATIDAAVQADDNKFFTYNNFTSNLTNDINGGGGPGGGSTPGITNLMDGRSDYLLGLSDFTQAAPAISLINVTSTPIINQTVTVTASISNGTAAYLKYRGDVKTSFSEVEMFDDGAHNDGAANDGVYGAEVMVSSALTQYYVYAENNNAGIFSPERAAHEFYSFTATVSEPTVGDLVINEFMASNDISVADQDGEFDDWIELYNNSSSSINLEGYFLSDDSDDLTQWEFPSGTVIPANGYLTVWADNDEEQLGLHTNFKLSASAESIFLVNPSGEIVDEVSYVDQTTDVAYGRFPNGTGNFQEIPATFGTENGVVVDIETPLLERLVLKATPNPASTSFSLQINASQQKDRSVTIYDLTGKQVYQNVASSSTLLVDTSDWSAGVYVVKVEGAFLKVLVW
ncbi:MAG: lamin tail domain-containing protein, partial [Chitinophagales bacterium]